MFPYFPPISQQEESIVIPIKPKTEQRLRDYYRDNPQYEESMKKHLENTVDHLVNDILNQAQAATEKERDEIYPGS